MKNKFEKHRGLVGLVKFEEQLKLWGKNMPEQNEKEQAK